MLTALKAKNAVALTFVASAVVVEAAEDWRNATCSLPRVALFDCCDVGLHGPRGNHRCFDRGTTREACCGQPRTLALLQASPHARECFSHFWSNATVFLRFSGAPVDISPLAASQSTLVATPTWLSHFRRAEAAASRCEAAGWRYFRVHLWAAGHGDAATDAFCFGLCAPPSCGAVAAKALAWHVVAERQGASLGSVAPWARLEVHEASRWSALQLDWVIAGFMKCGTTSFAGGLGLSGHPQLAMPSVEGFEDVEPEWMTWRVLVSRQWVRRFNERVAALTMDKRRRVGRVFFGLKNPTYVWNDFMLYAFSRVPELKLLLIVRDPLDALASAYFFRHANTAPALRPSFSACVRLADGSCFSYGSEDGRLSRNWFAAYRMAAVARRAVALMGRGRVSAIHADSLRAPPREALGRVAAWLGVAAPFPAGAPRLRRRNRFGACFGSRGRPANAAAAAAERARWRRTERLCASRNAGARRWLLRRFRGEYRGVAHLLRESGLGGRVPRSLARAAARCPVR